MTTASVITLREGMEVMVGNAAHPLSPYEMLRVPPGTPHGLRSPGPARVISLSIPPPDGGPAPRGVLGRLT